MKNFIELLKDGVKEIFEQHKKIKQYLKTIPGNVTSKEMKFKEK